MNRLCSDDANPKRFFGFTEARFLWTHAVKRAREWTGLTHVIDATNPSYGALETQTKAAVRHAAEATQVNIPFVLFKW